MIRIINIMPKSYLYKYYLANNISTQMYIAMAHLVLEDKKYSEWSRKQKKLGRYVILDNSAPYLGCAVDNNYLFRCIDILNPDEVVLPDVIGNYEETVKRSLEFLDKIKCIKNLKIMAVPQGSFLNQYIKCYNVFSSNKRIEVIGLSCTVDNLFSSINIHPHYINSREYLIKIMKKESIINQDKEHHLLGFGHSGHIELKKLRKFQFIRSCDSNAAYINAKSNIKIKKGIPYKKPEILIKFDDYFNEVTYKLFLKNIKTLEEEGGYKND